jgi:hypothetical protein
MRSGGVQHCMDWRFWSDVESIKRCSALETDKAVVEVNSSACTAQREGNHDIFEQSLPVPAGVNVRALIKRASSQPSRPTVPGASTRSASGSATRSSAHAAKRVAKINL